jgi:ATP-dependent Lhr-like helicase
MSEAAFSLLSPFVQRSIFDMGWKQLRPIQAEAIEYILQDEGNLLICAATASGKTEAAFLPVISKLTEGKQESIRAIYIGPLKALINDQFNRLDLLCERLELPVHRWHGDVTASHKKEVRQNPSGILLITPESLESNFINYGLQVPRLYRDLEFIVIDELHSFLGGVRGFHLLSLLARLRAATKTHPRLIGLSATLSTPDVAKSFLQSIGHAETRHIQDSGNGKEVRFALKAVIKHPLPRRSGWIPRGTAEQALQFVQGRKAADILAPVDSGQKAASPSARDEQQLETNELDDISEDLIKHFGTSTNLVFVNSRRTAEELSVRTHDRVTKLNWPHDPFMIHHGSVAKEVREEAETALKSGVPTTVICSSTLEMGIDIGSVRAVGQIDPPWTVASFVQRLGRSGRREGEPAIMRLYVREESPHVESRIVDLLFPELLRGIALTRLMQEKWLEPTDQRSMQLSTFVHQILSVLKQTGGILASTLHHNLCVSGPFHIDATVFASVLRSLASKEIIEQLPTGEIILAPAGERIASGHDFYAAFKSSEMFTVRNDSSRIGELPFDALPPAGQLVVLAGRRWLVKDIDVMAKTVWVIPGHAGKVPSFLGNGGDLHSRVVQEMRDVLLSTDEPPYLDSPAKCLLAAARHAAHAVGLDRTNVLSCAGGIRWFPWVGTKCLRTLAILAQLQGEACETDRLSIWFAGLSPADFNPKLEQLLQVRDVAEIGKCVTPQAVEKFDELLPEDLLLKACVVERLSLEEAEDAIRTTIESSGSLADPPASRHSQQLTSPSA